MLKNREKDSVVKDTPRTAALCKNAMIAVYDTHQGAEAAIQLLEKSGFDMTNLSIVGKDYQTEEHVVGYYTAGSRMLAWGTAGAFWGGIWSMLFGWAFFFIPGVGPLLTAGPLVTWIVGVLEGAVVVGGLSALGAALYSIGIPNDAVIEYETQIKAGKFVIIAHDVPEKLEQAREILEPSQHQGLTIYIND